MFRIKTDIRQYKCESQDKVEKLIRNWVIRPNDLILNDDQDEWSPIGEHPAFVRLFGMLEEEERNTPDTVVTRSESARNSEEVTHLIGRPAFDEDSEQFEEEARETDIFEQAEIAQSMSEAPAPPTAPEGVEPPAPNDEVTMMTERTLELLTITDEEDAAKKPEATEEVTDVRKRDEEKETPAEPEAPAEEENSGTLGRHDLPEELFATNEISSPLVQEALHKLDELAELSSSPSEASEEEDETAANWSAAQESDAGVDEAWEAVAEQLRTTDELDADNLEETVSADRVDSKDEDVAPTDEGLGDTDEAEREDLDDEDIVEIAEVEPISAHDFVSEGYAVPLPFAVAPSEEDIALGLKLSKYSTARKDKTFALPEPKELDVIHRRKFDLTPPPPRDHTVFLVVGFVAILLVLVTTLSMCT